MTWLEFKQSCEILLTVDGSASRQAIGGYNAILLRNGVSDLQRFIPQLKSNQRNTYRVTDLAQEGETSLGTLPDKASVRQAFIITKTCPCMIFPLVPYQWDFRYDLVCDKPRRHEWPYYIAIDPSATEFMVYPRIKDEGELWIYWDGMKTDYADADPVRFGDDEALAVSYYIKSHIAREVDHDLSLRHDYWESYAGGRGVMGLRTKLFLDWKERGEVRLPVRPPEPSCDPCSTCSTMTCCWDYSCATGGFSQGFWYLKHPTTGFWHKITASEELGGLAIKIYPGIEDSCIEFDDCLTAASKGYIFSGGYFHLLNETSGKFIALSVIGAPGEEMLKLEPQKGTMGHISKTAFGYRLDSCLELRNLDDTCNRNTWHTISLADMGAPTFSIGASDCVICPPGLIPEPPPAIVYLSAQQAVSCGAGQDLSATYALPAEFTILSPNLLLEAEYASSIVSQEAADAAALAHAQEFFDASIASGLLVCAAPLSPLMADLCRWWKADSYALNDNTPVGDAGNEWVDQISGACNMVQAIPSLRPVFKTNVFGARPAIHFDEGDELTFTPWLVFSTTELPMSQDCTIIVVYKQTAADDVGMIFGDGTTACQIWSRGSLPVMRAFDGIGGLYTSDALATPVTSPKVIIFRNKPFELVQMFRENKTNRGPLNGSNLGFEFHRLGAGGGAQFAGDIAEILVYCKALEDSVLDGIYDSYLKPKFSVLPAS